MGGLKKRVRGCRTRCEKDCMCVCSLADACARILAMCTVVECHAKLKVFP